ncbi:ABC transporter ATP-binding protein [Moritella marina ATCC 15381]|uniref:ABC transporter ATP-binding protein n=1 Tax=Moritella marina ATCC 15381 TaxID=1202962 RepID=A0A5J6WNK6_MORMI|nr:ABC transporter ATP-binding protein [Moritella marina]QFI38550.1 ABC transporter ATP-binding protein [Moritella marina ATCC 15381]
MIKTTSQSQQQDDLKDPQQAQSSTRASDQDTSPRNLRHRGNRISWKLIRERVLRHKKPLISAYIIAVFATLVSVPIPLMMPLLVDEVLLEKPGAAVQAMQNMFPESWWGPQLYILAILGFVVCLRLSSLVLSVWQARQFTIIGKHLSFYIRDKLMHHLPLVSLTEYETQGSGAISSRCITDVETIDKFLAETLSKFLVSMLTILGTAAILLWIDWQLGLIILLLNPAVIYFSRSFGKRVKNLKTRENAAFEAFQEALIDTLDAIQQLRTAQREKQYFSRVIDAAGELRDSAIQSQWKTDAVNRLSFTIFLIGFEVFRAIAMLMVVFADLTIGQIFAVFGYLWFMMGPVQELLSIQYTYFAASAALKRLNSVFELTQEPQHPCVVDPFASQDGVSVEFKDVCFAYNAENKVIRNVNLTIPKGKKVAIVAVSGGGKSTLVQLLLGLYEKQQGEILINDVPLNQVGYDKIRENIATVLQQPILFNTSIRENLSMGHQFSDDELWKALQVAEMADTIQQLGHGLETLVGRNGVRLSGGQRQRLAIARMVLSKPQMVVFDEATSALDTETESRLHHNLSEFLQDRTTLIIAHRLSAIKQADLIYVLDDGEISQSGQHHELLQVEGLYQTLYGRLQSTH